MSRARASVKTAAGAIARAPSSLAEIREIGYDGDVTT
jgi:hypothetical protein